MPKPRSQELKDRAKKIKKLLRKKKLYDKEIASILNLTVNDIAYCRKEFNIKSGYTKSEVRLKATEPIKKAICAIINKEHPQEPRSDEMIRLILADEYKINTARTNVLTYRYIMEIPRARKRQQIYFTKGRMIWNHNLNHTLKK